MKTITQISALIIFFFGLCKQINGQVYTIPDANFRNYLLTQYPSVLNASQQLIIANANNLNAPISCTNLSITDLSGIEYFYKATMINCSGNPITTLPALDSLKSINHLWAIGCQLQQLPKINHLITLQTLDVKNNQLISIPSLTGLSNLQYFDCSGNALTVLPDLSGLISLQKLYCYNNQLSQLPSLSTLTNLQVLDCPVNILTSIPDLSSNTALTTLRCSKNRLSVLPNLSSLINLSELSVDQNQLTVLPDLSANTLLSIVNIAGNKLTGIPDFSGYSNLTNVYLQNNQLSFSQLLPQTNHPSFATVFQFIPQDTLLNFPLKIISRDTIGFVFSGIDPGLSSNQYAWHKNNTVLASTVEFVELSPPQLSDSGSYWCTVQNTTPALSGLTLVVKSARVEIGGCINASVYNYSIVSNSCMKGAEISFDESGISSIYKPFQYFITSSIQTQDSYVFDKPFFQAVNPGKYDIRMVDVNNCSLVLKQYLTIPVPSDCDNIITPNGDGVDDQYFIEKTGKAKIFTKNGSLIKQLNTPAVWDATDHTGKQVDMGYYIIVIDEKTKIGIIVLE